MIMEQWFSILNFLQNHLEVLLEYRVLGLTLCIWFCRSEESCVFISTLSKFPGDIDAVGVGSMFWTLFIQGPEKMTGNASEKKIK